MNQPRMISSAECPQPELWHPRPGTHRPLPPLECEVVRSGSRDSRSAFEIGLDSAGGTPRSAGRFSVSAEAAEQRLAELEEGRGGARPLVCRIPAGAEPPTATLEAVSDEICEALDGVEDLDPYELAAALYELGLFRPAILLLDRAVRLHGPQPRTCELMARCLLALDLPDLALLWTLRPLRDEDLEFETVFELVRLASVCQMQTRSESSVDDRECR